MHNMHIYFFNMLLERVCILCIVLCIVLFIVLGEYARIILLLLEYA